MNVNDTKDYELYLEHVPGIIATDLTGTIMYLNQQCADYLGGRSGAGARLKGL